MSNSQKNCGRKAYNSRRQVTLIHVSTVPLTKHMARASMEQRKWSMEWSKENQKGEHCTSINKSRNASENNGERTLIDNVESRYFRRIFSGCIPFCLFIGALGREHISKLYQMKLMSMIKSIVYLF